MSMAEEPTDLDLMQRYARGELAAFETLLRRHEKALWRFIVQSLRDVAAAEDVMQDTWLTLIQQAPRYLAHAREHGQSAQFRTWLFTLARSRSVDHLRRKRPELSYEDFSDSQNDWLSQQAADSNWGPLAQVQGQQQASALLQALADLPLPQREAFLLQAEAGMSVQEIAQTCNISFETAKTRLRYARAKLKACLAEWSQSGSSPSMESAS
jgi:RNA polymerase sigma factor (sigma-70 family)